MMDVEMGVVVYRHTRVVRGGRDDDCTNKVIARWQGCKGVVKKSGMAQSYSAGAATVVANTRD